MIRTVWTTGRTLDCLEVLCGVASVVGHSVRRRTSHSGTSCLKWVFN